MEVQDCLWKMYFDGSSCKEGAGASIVLISPGCEIISLMYKLEFQTTTNISKYEALVLRIRDAKELIIQQVVVFWISEFFVVRQVKNVYHVKQQLLKAYRNEIWDLVDNFFLALIYLSSQDIIIKHQAHQHWKHLNLRFQN